MKILLLRHEIRNLRNPTFYSPLLKEGLDNAVKLINILKKHNIDLIFSSPFKRVLQTIEPYCNFYNNNFKKILVNIDYSLYEQVGEHSNVDINFKRNNFRKVLKNTDFGYNLINKRYKSYIPITDIKFTFDTYERSQNFLKHIIYKYKYTDKNILIASHEGILLQMLEYLFEKDKIINNIPMGGLIMCYDNGKTTLNCLNF